MGISSGWFYLFYTEVTDEDRVCRGGGLEEEGEMIEVVEIKKEHIEEWNDNSPIYVMYAIMWWMKQQRQ